MLHVEKVNAAARRHEDTLDIDLFDWLSFMSILLAKTRASDTRLTDCFCGSGRLA
eukprot:COSAG01_NODE_50435_length_363_cov_1.162879_2_plen_54_part_01